MRRSPHDVVYTPIDVTSLRSGLVDQECGVGNEAHETVVHVGHAADEAFGLHLSEAVYGEDAVDVLPDADGVVVGVGHPVPVRRRIFGDGAEAPVAVGVESVLAVQVDASGGEDRQPGLPDGFGEGRPGAGVLG